MQGKLTIKNVWSNINDLDLTDANGGALDFTVTSGDTVKFYYAEKIENQVLLYQGTDDLIELSLEGSIMTLNEIGISHTSDMNENIKILNEMGVK